MTLRLRVGAATDVGRVRAINQDSYLVLDDKGLYVVADGMGGHQGGEVASKLAVDVLRTAYLDRSADALADAIADANERIHDVGEADPDLRGMGTTLVAAAIVPEAGGAPAAGDAQLVVANVGDSRAYLFRSGDLTQLTEDHSMVADLLREGRISEEEAEVHPQRNIVTRVLGVYDQVDVDLWPVDAVRGDRLLLCSDGLFNEVASDQIAAVLRRLDDPQEAAAELVRRALEGGGRDNVTVLVLDVLDDGGSAEAASAALDGDPSGLASGDGDRVGSGDPALGSAAAGARSGRRASRRKGRDDTPRASRITWRSVVFALAVVAVIGGAFATIQWYGTSTYFVGYYHGEVSVYRGRPPEGVLWIKPKLVDNRGIKRSEVPPRYRQDVEEGLQFASVAKAEVYISDIDRDIAKARERAEGTTTTTTTLPPGASTTTPTAPTTSVAHG